MSKAATPLSESNIVIPPIKLPGREACKSGVAPLRAAASALEAAPSPKAQTSTSDPLTPRILEALALLDREAAALGALSPRVQEAAAPPSVDEEPEWLKTAEAHAFDAGEATLVTTAAKHNCDADAVETAQGAAGPPDFVPVGALPVAVTSLAVELRQAEMNCAHLRNAALTQANTAVEVQAQLELTKSAAEATAAAARRIVDDHDKDIALLLAELRRVAPEAATAAEAKLSAPLAALAARRRHAQAAISHQKKHKLRANSPQRVVPAARAQARPGEFERSWLPETGGAAAAAAATTSTRGAAQAPSASRVEVARAESPLLERFTNVAAAAADLGERLVRRAGSPFRGRPM